MHRAASPDFSLSLLCVAKGLVSLGSMAKTMQSVNNCAPHVTLCQLVESMAQELNLEKTQFKIEEIMKSAEDTEIILDHESMIKDGWQVEILIPEDAMVYANT